MDYHLNTEVKWALFPQVAVGQCFIATPESKWDQLPQTLIFTQHPWLHPPNRPASTRVAKIQSLTDLNTGASPIRKLEWRTWAPELSKDQRKYWYYRHWDRFYPSSPLHYHSDHPALPFPVLCQEPSTHLPPTLWTSVLSRSQLWFLSFCCLFGVSRHRADNSKTSPSQQPSCLVSNIPQGQACQGSAHLGLHLLPHVKALLLFLHTDKGPVSLPP